MFKVGDIVRVVSTPEELGGLKHDWRWYGMRRWQYLGRKCRITYDCGVDTYLLCKTSGYAWEAHQLRKVE